MNHRAYQNPCNNRHTLNLLLWDEMLLGEDLKRHKNESKWDEKKNCWTKRTENPPRWIENASFTLGISFCYWQSTFLSALHLNDFLCNWDNFRIKIVNAMTLRFLRKFRQIKVRQSRQHSFYMSDPALILLKPNWQASPRFTTEILAFLSNVKCLSAPTDSKQFQSRMSSPYNRTKFIIKK